MRKEEMISSYTYQNINSPDENLKIVIYFPHLYINGVPNIRVMLERKGHKKINKLQK